MGRPNRKATIGLGEKVGKDSVKVRNDLGGELRES